MALSAPEITWLRSKVGDDPDDATLEALFTQLGSLADVAHQVLSQRLANLLAGPAKMAIPGEYEQDTSANIKALQAALNDPALYDDVGDDNVSPTEVRIIPPAPRPRR